MADINVGGVRASLSLDLSDWQKGARDATATINTWKASVQQAFDSAAGVVDRFQTRANFSRFSLSGVIGEFQKLGASVQQALGPASAAISKFAKDNQDAARTVAGLGASMAVPLALGVKGALDLGKSLRVANTAMKLSESDLSKVNGELRQMAVDLKLGKQSSQLADGLYDVASASFEGTDGLKVLRDAALGAKAGQVDVSLAGEALAKSLRGMGVGAESSTKYMDIMFATVDKGILRFSDLAQGIGKVTSFAKSSGVSFEELGASIAVLTQRGSTAEAAMTGLRQLFIKLSAPEEESRKALKALGVEYGDAAIKAKGLRGVLVDLFNKSGGSKQLLKPLLDTEGLDAALKLVESDGGSLLAQRTSEMFDAAGKTKAAADEIGKADKVLLDQIKVNTLELLNGLGAGIVATSRPFLEFLERSTAQMTQLRPEVQATAGVVAGLIAAVTSAAGAFLLFAPGIAAAGTALKNLGTLFGPIATAARAVAAAIVAVDAAPIIALGAAVAAVSAAYLTDFAGIRTATIEFVGEVKAQILELSAFFGRDFKAISQAAVQLGADFKTVWPDIKEGLQGIGYVAEKYLAPVIRTVFAAMHVQFTVVTEAVKTFYTLSKTYLEQMGKVVSDLGTLVLLVLRGDWAAAWDFGVKAVEQFVPRVIAALSTLPDQIRSSMANVGQAITDGLNSVLGNQLDSNVVTPLQRKAASIANSLDFGKLIGKASNSLASFGAQAQTTLGALFPKPAASPPPVPTRTAAEAEALVESSKNRKASTATPKRRELSRSELLDGIRRGAQVDGSANIGGLDNETLKATYRLVENAVANQVKLIVTSAYRSTSRTFHGAGKAVDVYAPQGPATIKALAENTGFKSGINEFDPAARAWTGGTGDHVHLTTGQERLGNTGVFSLKGNGGGKLFAGEKSGAQNIMDDLERYVQKLQEFKLRLTDFIAPKGNQFDAQRKEIRDELLKLQKEQQDLSLPVGALNEAKLAATEKLDEINRKERATMATHVAELEAIRLEANGRTSEVLRLGIERDAKSQIDAIRQVAREYPILTAEVEATVSAIQRTSGQKNKRAQFDLAASQLTGNLGLNQQLEASGFSSQADVGKALAGLDSSSLSKFPELRSQFDSALQSVRSYFSEGLAGAGSEEKLSALRQALDVINQIRGANESLSAEKLRQVEFDAQLGKITQQQRIEAYKADLDGFIGTDAQKREKILGLTSLIRDNYVQQLALQGDSGLESLAKLQEQLLAGGELTAAKMAELGAIRQIMADAELQQQQRTVEILGQVEGSFAGFFGNVLSGQQSLNQGLTGLWKNLGGIVVGEISKMIAKALILNLLMGAVGSFFGFAPVGALSGGGIGSSIGGIANILKLHDGGLVQGVGRVQKFHDGGYVGKRKFDEVPALLLKGEAVLNRRQTANLQRSAESLQSSTFQSGGYGGISVNFGDVHVSNQSDADYLVDRMMSRLNSEMAQRSQML